MDKLAVVPETGERLEEEPSEAGESGIRNEKRRLKDLKISIREKECGSENTKMGAWDFDEVVGLYGFDTSRLTQ